MAIDFNNRDALDRLNDLFRNPTGWGGRVINTLTAAFGPSNPFNSAALANSGDAAGNVPLLGSDGVQERHLKPASTTTAGAVRIAPGRTTNTVSDGFQLVLAASVVADVLRTSALEQNLFGAPIIVRPTSNDFTTPLPTEEGFFLAIGAGASRDSSVITFFEAQAVGETLGFSLRANNATSLIPTQSNAELLSQSRRGNAIRFGLLLRNFGQLHAQDFQDTPGDVVFGYKETTPSGMRLRIRGGRGGLGISDATRARFVVFPVN